MSDSTPPGPDPVERVTAALSQALTEIAEGFRAAAGAGLAADRAPGQDACHCLCGAVHRDSPGICDGFSVGTVRVSAMDVPMCAPCQAARAAAKLSPEP